jgi:hypothetical protein
MSDNSLTIEIVVPHAPEQVFDYINESVKNLITVGTGQPFLNR